MRKRHLYLWPLLFFSFVLFSCSDNGEDDPNPVLPRFVSATAVETWSADQLRLLLLLGGVTVDPSAIRYDAEIFRIVYRTQYRDQEIEASGLIALPATQAGMPMVSFHHGTIIEHKDAPSAQAGTDEEIILYAALSAAGYITTVPDMIGFGESTSILHPYYVEEPTAAAVIDLLIAAREFVTQKGNTFNGQVFLAGYSQGGYTTMAAHKALESNPVSGLNLVASFPAAGGYDLLNMQQHFLTVDTYPSPHYLAYVGMSYATYYENPAIVDLIFAPEYAAVVPGLFNGTTSKTQIDEALTEDMKALLNPELLANPDDAVFDPFVSLLEENSLTDWAPKAPMYMYHGDADIAVPYSNSVSTYEKLKANGATNVSLITLEGHDHGSGVVPYVEDVVRKLEEMRR